MSVAAVQATAWRAGSGGGGGGGGPELRWLAVPVGYLAASVPFSYVVARLTRGVDLRAHGTGTVSGTGLYEVAGFGPLAVAGVFEVAKGAVGPLLARGGDPRLAAAAGAAAVAGHNWSPWLRGAGGRGLSPALGALLVGAPAGAAVLLGGMVAGRLAGETALGTVAADAALVPVAGRVHGPDASRFAAAVLAPMVVKRLVGNGPPARRTAATYLWRALFDRDTRRAPSLVGGGR
ncbi:MAG TPA: glycerol-3-phosphate acyltransferase [Acidimicrobiales bacterium]|nr:glycerol-3-phosphate acyltransferase [Acidimicrobiales bacterium]